MDVFVPLRHAEGEVAGQVLADVDAPGKQEVALPRGERPIVPDDVADRIGHRRLLLAAIVQRGSQRSDHASGLAGGAYQLEPFANADVEAAGLILDRYADLGLGLTDASLLVIAERHRYADLLTLDERHFRAVPAPGDRPFRLLLADAWLPD